MLCLWAVLGIQSAFEVDGAVQEMGQLDLWMTDQTD